MDAGMLCNRGIRQIKSFDQAVEDSILKINNFEDKEIIGIIDSTFACLATWLEGHSLAKTVFINLYLHKPYRIEDKILKVLANFLHWISLKGWRIFSMLNHNINVTNNYRIVLYNVYFFIVYFFRIHNFLINLKFPEKTLKSALKIANSCFVIDPNFYYTCRWKEIIKYLWDCLHSISTCETSFMYYILKIKEKGTIFDLRLYWRTDQVVLKVVFLILPWGKLYFVFSQCFHMGSTKVVLVRSNSTYGQQFKYPYKANLSSS